MKILKLTNIICSIISTTNRLTFDIYWQKQNTINKSKQTRTIFIASNGYQIISCKRMDIQTERIWVCGCKELKSSSRSGSMVFSDNEDRDIALKQFIIAIKEWDNQC